MKRHTVLVPLSREHYRTLLLAQAIKKGAPAYRGMPVDLEGKREAFLNHFAQNLIAHFRKEEALFAKLERRFTDVDELIRELVAEHRLIESLADKLNRFISIEENLNELGHLLESHIRKEERQLFEILPKRFDDAFLLALE